MGRSGNPKPWVPLRPALRVEATPEHRANLIQAMINRGHDPAETEGAVNQLLAEPAEMWLNDHVVVTVRRHEPEGWVEHIHVRRVDRKPIRDWRIMQRIKNEIAGDEIEACELYPADSRLVDTANSYWLWCLPPGERFPFGMTQRAVDDGQAADIIGIPQRRFG